MVVVGNKLDRADKHRELSADVGREYAASVGASFAEVSAKTNEGRILKIEAKPSRNRGSLLRHCEATLAIS